MPRTAFRLDRTPVPLDDAPDDGQSDTRALVLLAAVKALCPVSDSDNKAKWDALVDALSTDLETFVESEDTPGTYVVDEDQTVSVGVGELAEVGSDDTAVDSYALSATGPGSGYVTVIEAQAITIAPGATESITDGSTSGTTSIVADAAGESLHLMCVVAGNGGVWAVVSKTGTWTIS